MSDNTTNDGGAEDERRGNMGERSFDRLRMTGLWGEGGKILKAGGILLNEGGVILREGGIICEKGGII